MGSDQSQHQQSETSGSSINIRARPLKARSQSVVVSKRSSAGGGGGGEQGESSSLSRPSTSNNVRPSTSPRPSIGSDSDVPYISYTVNRPIGESPKLQSKRMHNLLRSKSPSPSRSGAVGFNRTSSPMKFRSVSATEASTAASASGSTSSTRPRSYPVHDIVVVREFVPVEATADTDPDLLRLQAIPSFQPIMRSALNVPTMRDPEVLDKLDYRQLNALCHRYQRHLRLSAEVVAAEQNNLASRIREIDFAISTLVGLMTERQKKYVKYSEKLGKVHEISTTLDKCQLSLLHTIEKMEALNALLPADECLEPFVWTTG